MAPMSTERGASADPVDVDDLAASDALPAELDPEAALLCALLHSTDITEVRHITSHLEGSDFLNPRYGQIYSVIGDLVARGEPHTPTRVLSTLTNSGTMAGHQGRLLGDALQVVALLGTPAVGLTSFATDVFDAAYRRRFAATAQALTQASIESPTDALFEILLKHGRAMRALTYRRESFAE